MAYTSKVDMEKYNRTFPKRLRSLIKEKPITQSDLAKTIGVTQQAIGAYTRGETMPKLDYAQGLAAHFGVSLDYLTGETDVKSPDQTFQGIHKATGLSQEAIEKIKSYSQTDTYGILNAFLSCDYFYRMLENVMKSIDVRQCGYAKFKRELSESMVKSFGLIAKPDLDSGFDSTHIDTTFDDGISMLSVMSPSLTVLSRTDAAQFHLQEAQNNFKRALDEVDDLMKKSRL